LGADGVRSRWPERGAMEAQERHRAERERNMSNLLYWSKDGEPYHRDPMTAWKDEPLSDEGLEQVLRGQTALWAKCHETEAYANNPGVRVLRAAPPVAKQCKACRAAEAPPAIAAILRERGKP